MMVVNGLVNSRRTVHMLQLNSYYNERYFKWYRRNFIKETPFLKMLSVTMFWLVMPDSIMFAVYYAIVTVLEFWGQRIIADKKPLKFTARIKRMYGAAAVLLIVLAVPFAVIQMPLLWLALPILIVQTGIVIPLIANTVCKPVEMLVQQYYMCDAKKILASNPSLIKIGITGSYGKTSTKI
jgi:UDP-N-acetylmuramoyl-tripeptide--D-alanyl-D-alanine ligase